MSPSPPLPIGAAPSRYGVPLNPVTVMVFTRFLMIVGIIATPIKSFAKRGVAIALSKGVAKVCTQTFVGGLIIV